MSLLPALIADRIASRIWQRDPALFGARSAPARDAVLQRLGWLDAPVRMKPEIPRLQALAGRCRAEGLTEVCLLGMGGSSLCAEVLRDLPSAAHGATLQVVDTTDEQTITALAEALRPERTLFLVASKSGTTIEVTSLERYFGWLAASCLGAEAGAHFVAITDPGTPLVAHARTHGYRETLINPPDIGGRFSALSLFGLAPAALLERDLERLLQAGTAMADRCRADAADNPGLALGAFMAQHALAGRDKLTLLMPPDAAALGAWIEQLVAESTGKEGRGILPVVDEPLGAVGDYGADRAFVLVQTPASAPLDAAARQLESAGHPVFRLEAETLGAEFFRWEFATAVAGAALGINPFDEPNVREAKTRTQALLDRYRTTGALAVDPPLKPIDGTSSCLVRKHRSRREPARELAGRYLALLDYLPTDPARREAIAGFRRWVQTSARCATTHGVGPRYLHSTGQYHKGGPNTGLFVLLTAADRTMTAVPGTDYSFSVLKQAQALGDFDALAAAGRDVVHFHFDDGGASAVPTLERALWPAYLA